MVYGRKNIYSSPSSESLYKIKKKPLYAFMRKLNSCDYYHHHDVIWQLYKYTVSPWPKLKKLLGTKDRNVDTLKKNMYNHIE